MAERPTGPDRGEARVAWLYEFPYAFPSSYAPVFGDADLLPSSNVLATFWPARLQPDSRLGNVIKADAQIVEIGQDKATHWSLSFYNSGATVGGECLFAAGGVECERAINVGWKIYSAERFYDAPIVSHVQRHGANALTFTAHAALKAQKQTDGRWALSNKDGGVLSTGTLAFNEEATTRCGNIASSQC